MTDLSDLERDLRESLRGGYLFGNFDEPLDAASRRVVRVIQQRLSGLPCECTPADDEYDGETRATRAEWDAAYQRALLLWHQIDNAKSGDAQKDVIARALLEFRRR